MDTKSLGFLSHLPEHASPTWQYFTKGLYKNESRHSWIWLEIFITIKATEQQVHDVNLGSNPRPLIGLS